MNSGSRHRQRNTLSVTREGRHYARAIITPTFSGLAGRHIPSVNIGDIRGHNEEGYNGCRIFLATLCSEKIF